VGPSAVPNAVHWLVHLARISLAFGHNDIIVANRGAIYTQALHRRLLTIFGFSKRQSLFPTLSAAQELPSGIVCWKCTGEP
jgi:hypothetical protein